MSAEDARSGGADILTFAMRPIGYVSSSYKDVSEIPKGLGAKHQAEGFLDICSDFELGLRDIEGFSHLFVIWVFDRREGCRLIETPPTRQVATLAFSISNVVSFMPSGLKIWFSIARS